MKPLKRLQVFLGTNSLCQGSRHSRKTFGNGRRGQGFGVHAPDYQIVSSLSSSCLLPIAHHPQVVPFPFLENAGESRLDSLVQILEQA